MKNVNHEINCELNSYFSIKATLDEQISLDSLLSAPQELPAYYTAIFSQILLKGSNSQSLAEIKEKIEADDENNSLNGKLLVDFLSLLFQLIIALRPRKRVLKKKLLKVSIKLGLSFSVCLLDTYFSLINKDVPFKDIIRVFRYYSKLLELIIINKDNINKSCTLNTLIILNTIKSNELKEMVKRVLRSHHHTFNKEVCLDKIHSIDINSRVNANYQMTLLALVAEVHGFHTIIPYLSFLMGKGCNSCEFGLTTIKHIIKVCKEKSCENLKEISMLLNNVDLSKESSNETIRIYLITIKSVAKIAYPNNNTNIRALTTVILKYIENRNHIVKQAAFNALYWQIRLNDETKQCQSLSDYTALIINEIRKLVNMSNTGENTTNLFFRGLSFHLKILDRCIKQCFENKNTENSLKIEVFNVMFVKLMNKTLIFEKTHYIVRNKLYSTLWKSCATVIDLFSPQLIYTTLIDQFIDCKESGIYLIFFCLHRILEKANKNPLDVDEKKIIAFIFDMLQAISNEAIKIERDEEIFYESYIFRYETTYYDQHFLHRSLLEDILASYKDILLYIIENLATNRVINTLNMLIQRLQWFATSKNNFVKFLSSLLLGELIVITTMLKRNVSREININTVFGNAYNDLIRGLSVEVNMFGVLYVLVKITKTRLLFISKENYKRVLNLLPFFIKTQSPGLLYLTLKLIMSISKRLIHEIDDEKCWNNIMLNLVEFAFKTKHKRVKEMGSTAIGHIASDIGPLDCIYYLIQGLSNHKRGVRIQCSVSILEITKRCGAFSVMPVLLNEYGAKNKLLRLGVLKSLQLIMSEETPENTNYINSLVNILEDCIKDKDIVHRQIGCFIISNITKLVKHEIACYYDIFLHFLNLIWPNILEDEFKMSEAFESAVINIGTIVGIDVVVMYLGSGLFHPARRVRTRCWGILDACWEYDSGITAQAMERYSQL